MPKLHSITQGLQLEYLEQLASVTEPTESSEVEIEGGEHSGLAFLVFGGTASAIVSVKAGNTSGSLLPIAGLELADDASGKVLKIAAISECAYRFYLIEVDATAGNIEIFLVRYNYREQDRSQKYPAGTVTSIVEISSDAGALVETPW